MTGERISRAIKVMREIELEVRLHWFPAYTDDELYHSPDISVRFRDCIRNVVEIYCALDSRPTLEVTVEREASKGIPATG
jgi:hypothetical protein